MSTLKQRTEAKLVPFTREHFTVWARMEPADREYDFDNSDGGCPMGRYMAAQGRAWFPNYLQSCREVFGVYDDAILAAHPRTFGGLVERIDA